MRQLELYHIVARDLRVDDYVHITHFKEWASFRRVLNLFPTANGVFKVQDFHYDFHEFHEDETITVLRAI